MSCYYSEKRDMLMLKCDGCGVIEDLYKGQTDRLLKHDWIHQHGWKTMKYHNRWVDICPDCKSALYAKKREAWLQEHKP